MTLSAGTRLGPYEIVAKLGEGGMGEVYRATDIKLRREVAIKVLPAAFTQDPERLARFEREAQLLAQLQHPNVAAIFGLEESAGVQALVMELVEGPTLEQRLGLGALPLDEALAIAEQIAAALEAAHERGIVHRDLKPANVKLAPEGRVKVLDFGLAKAMDAPGAASSNSPTLMNSPTLTAAAGTRLGVILGTAAYMSPEQARGRTVDRRADIWSFGVVLYEMLTGRRLFAGETVSETLAEVLKGTVDFATLPATTPRAVREMLRRALERDPTRRLQSIADARVVLQEAREGDREPEPLPAPATRGGARLAWSIATLSLLLALGLGVRELRHAPAPPALASVLAINPAPSGPAFFQEVAVAPDGRRLVAVVPTEAGMPALAIRELDSPQFRPLAGAGGARFPFWSPDGRAVGFFADGKLKKIDVESGITTILCDAPSPWGGSWGSRNTIVFAPGDLSGIWRVSSSGGTPVEVTRVQPGQEAHRWPSFLPDGEHFLYLGDASTAAAHHLWAAALAGGEPVDLGGGFISNPLYAEPGYVLYGRAGALVARRFDARALRWTGDPQPLAQHVAVVADNHRFEFSTSENGLLVYRSKSPERRFTWLDRAGHKLAEVGPPGSYGRFALSPDGSRVAVERLDEDGRLADLWLLELARGVLSRLTSDGEHNAAPHWFPDGQRIAYSSYRGGSGVYNLFQKSLAVAGADTELYRSEHEDKQTDAVSPDGRYLLFDFPAPTTRGDIYALALDGPRRRAIPIAVSAFDENDGGFSPDGQWVSFVSNESGRYEAYIQRFPDGGGRRQISTNGAFAVRWRRDGREIYCLRPGGAWDAVPVTLGVAPTLGAPVELFHALDTTDFEPSPDGQRFLVTLGVERGDASALTAVLEWPALLRGGGR